MTRKVLINSTHVVCICSSALLAASATYAAGTHVHGEGELGIAIEAGRVDLSLIAPEADVKSERNESQEALEARFADENLFLFDGTVCQLLTSSVGYASDEAANWLEPEKQDHSVHSDHVSDQHEHGDDEDHEGHSDCLLTWTYQCTTDPIRLTIRLFRATRLDLIHVQAIGESGAIATEVSSGSPEISLP